MVTTRWVGRGPRRFPVRGNEPYLSAAVTLLEESGCAVRKWRTTTTGTAHCRSDDWGIEVPEPRGPISFATLAHEVAHQLLHRSGTRPRWLEEIEAWEWALDQFARFDLPDLDKARKDAAGCLRYAAQKAERRIRNPESARAVLDRMPDWAWFA